MTTTDSVWRRGAFVALIALCVGMRASLALAAEPVAGHDHAQLAAELSDHNGQGLAEHLDIEHDGSDVDGFHGHATNGVGASAELPNGMTVHGFDRASGSPRPALGAVHTLDPPEERFRPPIF